LVRANPSGDNSGDIHRFEYYNKCNDITKYQNPRFASEYGIFKEIK
jgi:hypothetical protein